MTSANNHEIELFEPQAASEELWELFFQFNDAIHEETHPDPDDPPFPHDKFRTFLESRDPREDVLRSLVLNDDRDRVIGFSAARFSTERDPAYENNKRISNCNISVAKDFRRRGIGLALLGSIVNEAISRKVEIIQTNSVHETGNAFCSALKGKMVIESAENWLKFSDVDWQMMEQWRTEGPKRAAGVEIESFIDVPEGDLSSYCKLYSRIMMQQPLGELEGEFLVSPESRRIQEQRYKDMGLEWSTLITREPGGAISGLTETLKVPGEDHRVHQMLTGVAEEYRGRGLGKWLKAEMILRVREKHPEVKVFSTGNADSNAPMLSINQRMGFRRYLSEKSYKFQVSELNEKLRQI